MNVLEDPKNGIVDGNHRSFVVEVAASPESLFNLLIIQTAQYFSTVHFDCD